MHPFHAAALAPRALKVLALAVLILQGEAPAQAATALADQPIFATANVPGNLALLLSVEFPTAVSVAHTNRTYSPPNEYLGFFDPNKCYTYTAGVTDPEKFFTPAALATAHVCSGQWSGNFLNWASMQTIDPFRWVLTGGYRVIDEATRTVVEKAWASGQGGTGNFPDSTLSSSTMAGATPFPASAGGFYMRIQGLGNKMRFTTPNTAGGLSFSGSYYNNNDQSGSPVLTRTDAAIDFDWGSGSPAPEVQNDNFSARWTATVTVPTTGDYNFRLKADDRARLYINSVSVINQTSYQSMAYQNSSAIALTAGQTFTLQLDMREDGGGAGVQLQWQKPGDTGFSTMGAPVESLNGTATAYNGTATAGGVVYETFMRAKVCDATLGATYLESNCTLYGTNYKPEGLLQKYSNKIRYSAFGYLNDSNILRDGGVLRAQQKFVGPTKPVPGSTAITNTAGEWSASTGVFTINPDAADASATAAIFGPINNSGVINYLNKFGEITPGGYKTYDNVSELYYAAIRYFKALADVPEWTAVGSANASTKAAWADGFPVITSPADPILYSCQKNFVLGIGDVNTHADKNLPGRLAGQTGSEPPLPTAVSADTSVDAVAATDKVGALEGLGTIGTNATYNTSAIAGLAYDSHVKDIRPDDASKPNTAGKQTIDTYWVDVQEYQAYANNNQFYLATKYGGFVVPTGYDPNNTTPLVESWWHTNTDVLGSNKRPDNYFAGGRPDLMKAGLEAAFAKIADSIGAFTTSFSTTLPQVATTGNSSFSSQYEPKGWTGELTASLLSFEADATTITQTPQWKFSDRLATQLAGSGWNTSRRVLTWAGVAGSGVAFRATGSSKLDPADLLALDTSYVSGTDQSNYLNYLRGDQTNEVGSTATGSTQAYRPRQKLLGDIVGSKVQPVGPPSFPMSDATNPGYSDFKTLWASRRTVVYVGANDGMMHAINGALVASSSATPPLEADANYGQEMFAYVPRALFQGPTAANTDGLASLGNPSYSHHYMVNATPNVSDVDFARVPDAAGARQNPAATVKDWRSVLIGGLGKGGKAYYAIDVTDPVGMASGTEAAAASKVLWEFSNATTDKDGNAVNGKLGFTYGDPMVMKTAKYGWVVVFMSGYNNSDGKGYFFFVNPKTGMLLEPPVSTGAGSTTSDSGLAFGNAFLVDATDGTADAIYAGDLLGNVWRLDVRGTSGSYSDASRLTQLATLTDATAAKTPQPVTSRPSIEVHPKTKKRFVMIGTGRLLDASDVASTQGQTLYAIADGVNASFNATPFPPATTPAYPITRDLLTENTNVADAFSFDPATKVGWFEELGLDLGTPANTTTTPPTPAVPSTGIAWRIISDLSTASGFVSFTTTLPNGSVCSPAGASRFYARNFATAQTQLVGDVAYLNLSGTAIGSGYISVDGKLRAVVQTQDGKSMIPPLKPGTGFGLRRLNWRELQVVD